MDITQKKEFAERYAQYKYGNTAKEILLEYREALLRMVIFETLIKLAPVSQAPLLKTRETTHKELNKKIVSELKQMEQEEKLALGEEEKLILKKEQTAKATKEIGIAPTYESTIIPSGLVYETIQFCNTLLGNSEKITELRKDANDDPVKMLLCALRTYETKEDSFFSKEHLQNTILNIISIHIPMISMKLQIKNIPQEAITQESETTKMSSGKM